ncbi:MAG: PEP-CTERM sorting domain-containing protein [Planctomycetes bacterium]|nr:PEP-CTERM sorting domain-containing protein [Planctomycetota bacterium]
MKFVKFGVVASAFFFSAVAESLAGVTIYADQASFNAATSGITTIGFEGIAPADGFTAYGPGGSLTLSGVTFTAGAGVDLFVNSSTYYAVNQPPSYDLGSGDYLLAGNLAPTLLDVQLPGSGMSAVAFYFGTFDDSTSQVQITLSTGDVLTLSASYPTSTFVGFTSTSPITSLELLITGGDRQDTLTLDNFQFGTVVPEPGSIIVLCIGLTTVCGINWLRRRESLVHGS